eukprot:TRINITY_DN48767_c0_g1_i1.p1 TRINITY_DN48767_c0_g1~~TRINITY_DN48767_c0_g1_i1.p1  ORF type:complete len:386 (+),score=59.22 TRINITY_DN48767_c0_g1_i1:74-1231(+)
MQAPLWWIATAAAVCTVFAVTPPCASTGKAFTESPMLQLAPLLLADASDCQVACKLSTLCEKFTWDPKAYGSTPPNACWFYHASAAEVDRADAVSGPRQCDMDATDLTHVVGGETGGHALDPESLSIWNQLLTLKNPFKNHPSQVPDLASLGTPDSVSTQVVSGTIFKFLWNSGAEVKVLHQPWTNTLEVIDTRNLPNSVPEVAPSGKCTCCGQEVEPDAVAGCPVCKCQAPLANDDATLLGSYAGQASASRDVGALQGSPTGSASKSGDGGGIPWESCSIAVLIFAALCACFYMNSGKSLRIMRGTSLSHSLSDDEEAASEDQEAEEKGRLAEVPAQNPPRPSSAALPATSYQPTGTAGPQNYHAYQPQQFQTAQYMQLPYRAG